MLPSLGVFRPRVRRPHCRIVVDLGHHEHHRGRRLHDVDDLDIPELEGALHVTYVRSTEAHATVTAIDFGFTTGTTTASSSTVVVVDSTLIGNGDRVDNGDRAVFSL